MKLLENYFADFTSIQQNQLQALENLYKEWNEKINVISRKDTEQIYLHHVLHSLTIAAFANFSKETKVIDIGCGGGFPGVPLAIFFPETEFLLVDSIAKKLKVVNAIATELNLKNITTKHSRVEDIKGQKFDFAVSRAVAPLKDLWRWSKPLLIKARKTNIDNGLICLKGGDLHQEISESHTRPMLLLVTQFFNESYFEEKFLVYVKA
jgi:16S rRNA (guanine527-N7)-methyltransferase